MKARDMLRRTAVLLALFAAGCADDGKMESTNDASAGNPPEAPADSDQAIDSIRAPGPITEALAEDIDLNRRISLVRELQSNPDEDQLDAMFELVKGQKPDSLSNSEWRVVANEILETLRKGRCPGLGTRLVELSSDRGADGVVRDYALQQYILLSERQLADSRHSEEHEKLVSDFFSGLRQVLKSDRESRTSIPGTGFLGIAAVYRDIDSPEFKVGADQLAIDYALPIIASAASQELAANAASAIQFAAEIGLADCEESIRRFASDSATATLIRISSIFALRYYPNEENRLLLSGIMDKAGSRSPLRRIAKESLSIINNQG